LKLLSDSGLSLKLTKFRFAQLEVDYLGFWVSRNGLEVNPSKTKAIMQSKRPGSKKDIRSFLGMTGVYRRFIKHYSEKASPLTSMLRKEEPESFQVNSAQDEAFEFLRKAATSSPCLSLPRAEGLFIIETDASEIGLVQCCCRNKRWNSRERRSCPRNRLDFTLASSTVLRVDIHRLREKL
jgi:hypothetical protein